MDDVSDEQCLVARQPASRWPTASVSVHTSGLWTVVTIQGDMDLVVVPLFRGLVSPDTHHLVFELHQVTFMDASGLDLLLSSQLAALQAGGCVRLVAPARKVRRLLMLTGAHREFTVFDSVDEAMSAPVLGPPLLRVLPPVGDW